jgi:hypothetical protein
MHAGKQEGHQQDLIEFDFHYGYNLYVRTTDAKKGWIRGGKKNKEMGVEIGRLNVQIGKCANLGMQKPVDLFLPKMRILA